MTTSHDSAMNSDTPATTEPAPIAPGAVNPATLTVEQLAKMLSLPAQKVRDHIAAGAPAAANGTINLVHYTAWLARQLAQVEKNDGD